MADLVHQACTTDPTYCMSTVLEYTAGSNLLTQGKYVG